MSKKAYISFLSKGALSILLGAFLLIGILHDGSDIAPVIEADPHSGGETTVFAQSREAFAKPAANLETTQLRDFTFGNKMFNTNWVVAPASVTSLDGLGPTFNRVSCSGCHFKDGRGRPPLNADEPFQSMLIRLSVPGTSENGGVMPHPAYGDQLNDRAIMGVPAEGKASITYEAIEGTYADGTAYELLKPTYHFSDMAFGELGEEVMFSPRVAPAVFGLGLLEAIAERDILAHADPEDADGDGISGRPNSVWDEVKQQKVLGRFGWKANAPTLLQQNTGAANGDIGITSAIFPNQNCPEPQKECQKAPDGGDPELSHMQMDKLTFYTHTLAVPARRNVEDPQVKRGAELFVKARCASCHTPLFTTGDHPVKAIAHQKIQPFTDLLLHDMGDGLADGRPDFEASGTEWRTPPLWGIGLVKIVNQHTRFLHDGRARNLEEAILWHGGEAEAAKEAFRTMSAEDRAALVAFLESL